MLAAGQKLSAYLCSARCLGWSRRRPLKIYFFIDVQARGNTLTMPREWERQGSRSEMTEQDLQLLKDHTVDFISFSYYIVRSLQGIS